MDFKRVQVDPDHKAALSFPEKRPPTDVVQWLRLPQKGNVLDHIDLELTPYIREPLMASADYDIETLIAIGPTQSAKSVLLQCIVADAIEQDPGPMLYIYPDEKNAKKALDEKIIQMIEMTPKLAAHMVGRWKKISKEGVKLDNMTIYPAWSNSPASISSYPMKRVVWDEVGLMNLLLGQDSNAIKKGQDRMTTYLNMGMAQGVMVSTPSVEGDLFHQQLSVPGTTIFRWHVPCPKCGHFQVLNFWDNLKRPTSTLKEEMRGQTGKIVAGVQISKDARCVCRFCEGEFPDGDSKKSWNNKGVYAPEGCEIDLSGKIRQEIPKTKRMVYWWDSMVSPFRSFKRIWREFMSTKEQPGAFRNFKTAWCAEFLKKSESKGTLVMLEKKKGSYLVGQVPDGVKVIVGGIDTQDTALYFTFWGFGGGMECWLIDEGRLECDMHRTNEDDLKSLVVDHLVRRRFSSMDGKTEWQALLFCWDSGGHRTKEVYAVVNKVPRLLAIKGRNQQNRRVIYSKSETHYNVKTEEFLDETEEAMSSEKFHIPKNVSKDFLIQFLNKSRRKERNRRTGEEKVTWISHGMEHLRMATAYTWATLDIPINRVGVLRARLTELDFECNPCKLQIKKGKLPEREEDSEDPFTRHERIEQERNEDFWE